MDAEPGMNDTGRAAIVLDTGAETYRPIDELVEELDILEEEAAVIDYELKSIFQKLGL